MLSRIVDIAERTNVHYSDAPIERGALPSRLSMLRLLAFATWALVAPLLAGCACANAAPPPSQLPNAEAGLDRMRATLACGTGIQASAKIDHFGGQGRIRGDLLMFVRRPASIRMDVVSPFGVALATLTSDGTHFALADLRDKRFFVGPASACNIARLTTVPVPGHVLVDLLRGEAPVLKHDTGAATIAWSGKGHYVISVPSTRGASEEIHLVPRPDDWNKPWQEQRMRVLDVRVGQQGYVLYHAELDEHKPTLMAKERIDKDGIEPPILPSGPFCDAEVPRKIHVEVPEPEADVQFRYEDLTWNPPLPEGIFTQPVPSWARPEQVTCE
jgi:hypothetical protein